MDEEEQGSVVKRVGSMPAYLQSRMQRGGAARGPWDEKVGEFLERLNRQRAGTVYGPLNEIQMRAHVGRYMKYIGARKPETRLRELCALWSICADAEQRGKCTFSQAFWGALKRAKPAEQAKLL